MTDLEQLTLSIDLFERWTEDAPELEALCDAARAYRDLLANPAEPDWKAAYDERDHQIGPDLDDVAVQKIVEEAVGSRLLVDKP